VNLSFFMQKCKRLPFGREQLGRRQQVHEKRKEEKELR